MSVRFGKPNIPKDWPRGRPHYYEQVWELVRLCPEGRVTTYGALADALTLGTPRMAGYAMRHSFGAEPSVPAHRVVNREGRLTGKTHFSTPNRYGRSPPTRGCAGGGRLRCRLSAALLASCGGSVSEASGSQQRAARFAEPDTLIFSQLPIALALLGHQHQ